MIVDERGNPFRPPFDWSGSEILRGISKRYLDMQMREFLRPSPLVLMLMLGRLRATAEECQRWENKGTLPPAGLIAFQSLAADLVGQPQRPEARTHDADDR